MKKEEESKAKEPMTFTEMSSFDYKSVKKVHRALHLLQFIHSFPLFFIILMIYSGTLVLLLNVY